MLRSSCFENIDITNSKMKPWTFYTSDSNWASTDSGFKSYGNQTMKYFSKLMNVAHRFTIWDLTYLLIALFLLNKFRIFFHGNLDGSLSGGCLF